MKYSCRVGKGSACPPSANQTVGFTLLEMLIAIGLGALLTTNLITVFVAFQQHLTMQIELADIQERGRFISNFLTEQIHRAGDASCIRGQLVNQHKAIGGEVLQLGECILYHDQLQFMQTQYYVADSGRKNKGQPVFSLFMKTLGSEREELVDGVENFQVSYGVSLPEHHAIAAYLPATAVTDWHLVHSVDISLTFAPSNQVWHIYAALRERLL